MRPLLLILLLPLALLHAETIDTLIERALSRHDSLQAIRYRLEAMDDYRSKSRNFADPQVSLSVSDIRFDDPLARDLEPMQYTAVNVRQTFPWFGKRDAQTKKVDAQKRWLFVSLEAAQVALAEAIRDSVYTIDELRERLKILDEYARLTRQNIDLNTAYTSTDDRRHMGIMSAELTLSQIRIRTEKLEAALEAERARLTYLSGGDVDTLPAVGALAPPQPKALWLAKLDGNRQWRREYERAEVAAAETGVRERATTADPYVQAGYYYRKAHPDYLSVTVGASLPVYGSQSDDLQAAKKEALSARAAAADARAKVRRDFEGAWARYEEAWRVYRIITDESLPQVEHMFDLSDSRIRSGGDLFAYIDLLEQKLKLDEQRIAARAAYLRAGAALKALTGEIK